MANKFGTGQDECKVCGQKLADVKAIKLIIKHKSGTDLVKLLYYAPLCDMHRGDGTLDIDIGWEPGEFPVDTMKDTGP
jgi:hypothetical protein